MNTLCFNRKSIKFTSIFSIHTSVPHSSWLVALQSASSNWLQFLLLASSRTTSRSLYFSTQPASLPADHYFFLRDIFMSIFVRSGCTAVLHFFCEVSRCCVSFMPHMWFRQLLWYTWSYVIPPCLSWHVFSSTYVHFVYPIQKIPFSWQMCFGCLRKFYLYAFTSICHSQLSSCTRSSMFVFTPFKYLHTSILYYIVTDYNIWKLSRVYTYCHSPRIGENEYSLRIYMRNHWYGSHLHLFAKRMLRKCKNFFSPPFSRTQNTAFSQECENVLPNIENTRKHPFTLIIFAFCSRLFSVNTDKCEPGFTSLVRLI